jgi:hypothetical protein
MDGMILWMRISGELSATSQLKEEDQSPTLDGDLLFDAYPSLNAKSTRDITFGFLRED